MTISLSLVWGTSSFADVSYKNKLKAISVDAFTMVFEDGFHKGIKKYNEDRLDISKLVANFKGANKKDFKNYYRSNKIKTLPEWKIKKEGYSFTYSGVEVFISPRLSYQSKILIQDKVFTFKSTNVSKEIRRLSLFLGNSSNFSLINLIINDANAVICGGFCVAIIVGGALAGGFMATDSSMTMLKGDTKSMDKILNALKGKHGQCRKEIRKHGITAGEVSPGTQETFKDVKKISEHLINYDIHYPSENRKLHAYVLKKLVGVEVSSCEEFAGLWASKAGALAKREARSSITASERMFQANSSKTKEVCALVDSYAGCLTRYKKAARSHNGKRDLFGKKYNPETGLYGEAESGYWEKLKSAVGFEK